MVGHSGNILTCIPVHICGGRTVRIFHVTLARSSNPRTLLPYKTVHVTHVRPSPVEHIRRPELNRVRLASAFRIRARLPRIQKSRPTAFNLTDRSHTRHIAKHGVISPQSDQKNLRDAGRRPGARRFVSGPCILFSYTRSLQ